jgi:nucleotide-binding universal stress UspA family protein
VEALRRGASILRDKRVSVEVVVGSGQPIEEIQKRTREKHYDFVVIGAERKSGGQFAMSAKAYHIIKEIEPPVLVVSGKRSDLKRVLICSGGKSYIDNAVKLTSEIACKTNLSVTILHVLPEAAPLYADMIEREETVENLLKSNSTLGRNLRSEKAALEAAGISAKVKLRRGMVVDQILGEADEGNYDMIVAGSAPAHAPVVTYILGNVTSEIVNNANCAVFVIRGGSVERKSFFRRVARLFSGSATK